MSALLVNGGVAEYILDGGFFEDGKDMVEIWVADDNNGLNAKVRIGVKINEGAKSGAQ